MKKCGLTFEQHNQLVAHVNQLAQQIDDLLIVHTKPLGLTHKVRMEARRLQIEISKLKEYLDDIYIKDHG